MRLQKNDLCTYYLHKGDGYIVGYYCNTDLTKYSRYRKCYYKYISQPVGYDDKLDIKTFYI